MKERQSFLMDHHVHFGKAKWKMLLDLKHSACAQLLFDRHLSEDPFTLEIFQRLASKSSYVFDIGANIGILTCLAAATNPGCLVYSYEPNKALRELIRMNSTLNSWEGRVFVESKAISHKAGQQEFFVMGNTLESTLMLDRTQGEKAAGIVQSYVVETVSLDQVFSERSIDPQRALVKIDVEGAEHLAIEGFAATLSGEKKPELICEILGENIGKGLIDRIISFGYQCYYIHRTGLMPIRSTDELSGKHELGFYNFYFTQKQLMLDNELGAHDV